MTAVPPRRLARELALQILYQCELSQHTVPEVLEHFTEWEGAKETVREFAMELVEGVRTHMEELDRRLGAVAENWSLDRMAPLDRLVLRIGAFELL